MLQTKPVFSAQKPSESEPSPRYQTTAEIRTDLQPMKRNSDCSQAAALKGLLLIRRSRKRYLFAQNCADECHRVVTPII